MEIAGNKKPKEETINIAQMPFRAVMELWFDDADDEDFKLKSEISDFMFSAVANNPAFAKGNSRHFVMACLDAARVLTEEMLRQRQSDASGKLA